MKFDINSTFFTLLAISSITSAAPIGGKQGVSQRVGLEARAAMDSEIRHALGNFGQNGAKERRQITNELIGTAIGDEIGNELGKALEGKAGKRQITNDLIGTALGDAIGNKLGNALQGKVGKRQDGQRVGLEVGAEIGKQITNELNLGFGKSIPKGSGLNKKLTKLA